MKISFLAYDLARFEKIVQHRTELVDTNNLDLSEDLCTKCGQCCRIKEWLPNGGCKILSQGCQYLLENNLCAVYSQRRVIAPNCVDIKSALLGCILPLNCSYVQKNWDQICAWYIVPAKV